MAIEQQKYQSGLIDLPGFQPRKRAKFDKQRAERDAQAERNQRVVFESIAQDTKTNIANAKQAGKDMEALATFSTSLSKQLVEDQKKRNEAEMQQGMMDVYENGLDTTSYDQGVNELRGTMMTTEGVAAGLEKKGADVFQADKVRRASGWRAYGQVIAKAQLGAANYPAFLAGVKDDLSVTITDENGNQKTLTYATATEPEEFAALQAEARSQYLKQFAGINPAVLNEHLFPGMRQTDGKQATEWARSRGAALKDEQMQEAFSDFDNGAVNIADTWTRLVNSGMSAGDARKALITRAARLRYDNKITQEQYEAIKATPFGSGGTWGSTNSFAFEDAEIAARSDNVTEQNLRDNEQQQAHDAEAKEWLTKFQTGNYSQEQVQQVLDGLSKKYPGSRELKGLRDFYSNSTIEARSADDMEAQLKSLWQAGDLTVAELQSGKYQGLDANKYQTWLSLAQQSEKLGANSNARVAAAASAQEAVKNQILDNIGRPLPGEYVDPSKSFAEADALALLDRRARELRVSEGLEWGEAYNRAGMELVQEIKASKTVEGSQWYVANKTSGDNSFSRYVTDKKTGEEARAQINQWKTYTQDQGTKVFSNEVLWTQEEAQALSNPNSRAASAADTKLRTYLNELNSIEGGERMTLAEAREKVLGIYGLKSERPMEADPWEETALDQDMLNELYSPYKSGPNSVAVQGGQPPPVIRRGVEGGRDVIQASVAFGAPPALAPLAAAVYANETGWGKYFSGKNNLFNIKGAGSAAVVQEGDINGSGDTWTESTQFKDYKTGTESVKDFWDFLQSNERYAAVLTAQTPMEALKALKAAGYATSPSYVQDVAATWKTMGIDPNKPYQPVQLTSSPWSNTSVMSPMAAVYITGNIGPTSTGQHLDVKRTDGSFFEYGDLDQYVEVDDKDFGRVPLSKLPQTGDWASHTNRNSHGRDYGTWSGTPVYLKNGATVVSNDSTEHGDYLVIELPNGERYSFLHGTAG